MNHFWFRTYVLLAFLLDKALRAISEHSPFVDCYYGPPEWKTQVVAEPLTPAPELLHEALDLAEVVSRLDLEPQRATFLRKQVLAMQTVCQGLCGETFTLEEELQRCFDIRPTRTAEALFVVKPSSAAPLFSPLLSQGTLRRAVDQGIRHMEHALAFCRVLPQNVSAEELGGVLARPEKRRHLRHAQKPARSKGLLRSFLLSEQIRRRNFLTQCGLIPCVTGMTNALEMESQHP